MDGHPICGLVLLLVFIVVSAAVSAAKAAILNINESNARKRAEDGDFRAKRVVKFLDTPHRYINSMEILITGISLLLGMIYTGVFLPAIAHLFKEVINKEIVSILILAAVTVLIFYLIVLFGMLLPRKLGLKYSEFYAFATAGIVLFLYRILFPFIWLLEKGTSGILSMLKIHTAELEDNVTEEEIISMVNEGQEQGVIEDREAAMISNIIEFNEKQAQDIMTHRKKIIAISSELTIEEALHFMLEENYSRFPLYDGDIDNIVGLLHLKDVMLYYIDPRLRKQPLKKAAREPYFIPDTQSINVLFHDMQSKKIHMAIAIDEYGQTSGIVAMEDILEEIVGDIQDEYDEEEDSFTRLSDGSYLIRGDASLEELEESLNLEFNEEDLNNYDTLNGLLVSLLDHIPNDDEKATIEYCGHEYEIVEVVNRMITSVKVTKTSSEEND